MIIKKRTKPLVLQKLEAVIPRLSPQFPRLAELQRELSRRYRGYIGEQKVDYHLKQFARKYTILQDVCLEVDKNKFQIDGLVITEHAIYCIEMKNFKDRIIFNTNLNQFTRSDGKIEQGYNHPVVQAETHQLQLIRWLHERRIFNIPVYFLVAISDPSTIIEVIGDEIAISKVVKHTAFIPKEISAKENALKAGGQVNIHHRKIGETILQACLEHDFNILRTYGIESNDIMSGVHCPECRKLGMERIYGTWKCHDCGKKSKHAHLRAIADYLLLVKPWINNKQCMRFLHLTSSSLATRILKTSNLQYQKKYRRWIK